MSRFSVADFLKETADRPTPTGTGMFELETDHFLQVHLGPSTANELWIKMGSMVAYRGNISFEREGMLSQGLGNLLKKAVSGEGARLTRAKGQGQLYLADDGKRVTVLELAAGESIVVNGSDLLCFEMRVAHQITMMRKLSAIVSGGLFNVRLTGAGLIALTTHHRPITLMVKPGEPVFTDPQATVAWSGSLTPDFKTDVQLKTLLGRGSGESFQMKFDGAGFVIVQPYEEDVMDHVDT
jgi:uncharacterized protein (AIM24 family)